MEDSMVGIFTWYTARGALNPKVVPWFIKLTRSARNAATRQLCVSGYTSSIMMKPRCFLTNSAMAGLTVAMVFWSFACVAPRLQKLLLKSAVKSAGTFAA